MDIEKMTNNEIWDHINQWSKRPNWGCIKPLVDALDMTQTSHRMMLSHIVRLAVENDQLDFLKDAVADNTPVFDANHFQLRVGPTLYDASLLEVINQNTVDLRLEGIQVERTVPKYEPMGWNYSVKTGTYIFHMEHACKPSPELMTRYVEWFRAFHEHHIMNNQPHRIPTKKLDEYNYLSFERRGHLWALVVYDSGMIEHNHAGIGTHRAFML